MRVRCAGAGHSHAPLVPTPGLLLDLAALSGVLRVEAEAGEAEIWAGTRIHALGEPLREAGVALRNQGDIDRQSLAGAIATGTHGTGLRLQNLSASVRGLGLVLADGTRVDCDAHQHAELFQAARLSLGALGVVTRVRMAVRPAYRLEEKMWLEDLDQVLERIDDLTSATRHFEFFWTPGHARAACKSLSETTQAPRYPLAGEGKRLAWSDEVLANDRPLKHSEMEYAVPAAQGPACLRALRALVKRDFNALSWPLEYRTLAADEVWLSCAYQRETVTLSVHQGIEEEAEPLFRACEEIFRAHEGRPHWGKVHYLAGPELAGIHPRYEDWWRVRDAADPEGRFLNRHLEQLRPSLSGGPGRR